MHARCRLLSPAIPAAPTLADRSTLASNSGVALLSPPVRAPRPRLYSAAQVPAVVLARNTSAAPVTSLEERVVTMVSQTTTVEDGREELAVATAMVVAVAPALELAAGREGCRLAPTLCVKVDYRDLGGRTVRREHRLPLTQ
jgi:hypothetical protein